MCTPSLLFLSLLYLYVASKFYNFTVYKPHHHFTNTVVLKMPYDCNMSSFFLIWIHLHTLLYISWARVRHGHTVYIRLTVTMVRRNSSIRFKIISKLIQWSSSKVRVRQFIYKLNNFVYWRRRLYSNELYNLPATIISFYVIFCHFSRNWRDCSYFINRDFTVFIYQRTCKYNLHNMCLESL